MDKVKEIEKIPWIWLHHLHLQCKFKSLTGKFTWGNKAKHSWVMGTNFFVFKSLSTAPNCVLPLHLKQTFPLIIFNEGLGEGDGVESRLPFKILLTLPKFSFETTPLELSFEAKNPAAALKHGLAWSAERWGRVLTLFFLVVFDLISVTHRRLTHTYTLII